MTEIDSYEYWMDQLVNRSPGTQRVYRIMFKEFLEYMDVTPNQLVEMQRRSLEGNGDPRENRVVENKVRAWLAELRKSKSPATCRLALATVKSFFALNLHPLRLTRLDRPQGESQGSRIPEREEVIRVLDAAKWKYRAAITFLKDSGLRLSDLVKIRWENKVDMGDGFWNFNLITEKRKVAACAFVGPETTRLLEQFKTKTGFIFKTTPKNACVQINKILKAVGVKGVTAHGFRKYFVTSMQHARVPEQYYLHMMGKKSSVYSEKRRSELFEAYRKAYPELSIYAQQSQAEEIERLENRINELERERSEYKLTESQVQELLRRIEKLEKQAKG